MKTIAALAIAAVAAIATPAAAQNIVVNGDFEAGNTGWTGTMGIGSSGANYAHSGEFTAATGCVGASCTGTYNRGAYISQALTTVAGRTYDLSFWVGENSGATSAFAVFWNGALVNQTFNPNNNSISGTAPANFRQFTFRGLTATGTNSELQLQGRQDPAGIFFDDVSVVASGAGAVPEPATWAMMMLGFGGMGFALRRGRKAQVRVRFA